MNEIVTKLTQLQELDAQADIIRLDKQAAIDEVLTDEVKAQLSAIDAEFDPITSAVRDTIGKLEGEIKIAVLAHGETVKGSKYKAIWTKPRVTWNNKALEGYAAAHPEIEKLKKVGNPSVSIRRS